MPCNMQGKGCLKGEAGGTEEQGLGTSENFWGSGREETSSSRSRSSREFDFCY